LAKLSKKKELAERERKEKRERINLLLDKTPELLTNPYIMAFLWYHASRNNKILSAANYAIIAGDYAGLNVPEGATLGAILQKSAGLLEILPDIPSLEELEGARVGGLAAAIAIIGAPFFYVYPELEKIITEGLETTEEMDYGKTGIA